MPEEPRILWQDERLLFLLKPAGVASQADRDGQPSLLDWLARQGHRCDPVHRLDRPVGGIMVFGLDPESVRRLSRQFANREVQKTYLAVTRPAPEPSEGELRHLLAHDRRRNLARVSPSGRPGELTYRTIRTAGPLALLEVVPHTGRPHQIRAQLAAIGCPILGDTRYGARKPLNDRSIALFASRLRLRHPFSGQELEARCTPEGSPWNRFEP
ncbi:MAG: RNA pseudouridine synthase [Candidatus Xenobia bacterium]